MRASAPSSAPSAMRRTRSTCTAMQRLMPKRKRAWASWNFLRWQREGAAVNDVAVTYWMNRLQGIDDDKPLFVSLNPPVRAGCRADLRQVHAASIRNTMPPPLPHRSGSARSRAAATPGSAAPGPAMVSTRMACAPALKSPKRSARPRRGASCRPNSPRLRSSHDRADRPDASNAAALYFGEVMHARLKPMGHRFNYRVMSLLIDLDRLERGRPPIAAVRRQPRRALQLS